ncbi:MAG: hypothetical protein U0794_10520 [Isosphaeraceae bacterium]
MERPDRLVAEQQQGDAYDVLPGGFASDGTPIGAEFAVNSTRADFQYIPAVSPLTDGGLRRNLDGDRRE